MLKLEWISRVRHSKCGINSYFISFCINLEENEESLKINFYVNFDPEVSTLIILHISPLFPNAKISLVLIYISILAFVYLSSKRLIYPGVIDPWKPGCDWPWPDLWGSAICDQFVGLPLSLSIFFHRSARRALNFPALRSSIRLRYFLLRIRKLVCVR